MLTRWVPVALTEASCAVIEHAVYGPYGEVINRR